MENDCRLIDANALKEQIAKEIHTYWTNGTGGYCLAEDVIPDIDNAPQCLAKMDGGNENGNL